MPTSPTTSPAPFPLTPATIRGLLTGFWADTAHTLEVSLRPEQARERLAARIAPAIAFPGTAASDRPLQGRVHADGFTVGLNKAYQNSFQTMARGRWEAHGSRLRIAMTCGVHPFVRLFMRLWLGLCAVFCVIFPLGVLAGAPVTSRGPGGQVVVAGPAESLLFALAPFAMMAFGLGLCAFGRYLARDEEAALLAAIEDALAKPAPV